MTLFPTEMELLDIHTHHLPEVPGTALYCLNEGETVPVGHFCSVGVHPWNVTQDYARQCAWVREVAADANVLAIGEIGLDNLRGPSIDMQLEAFRRQISISEELGMPVILHVVRQTELLLSVRKEMKPVMPWLVHGFRGGPQLALQLMAHGISLSFGRHFNPETLACVGADRILVETDEFDNVNIILDDIASCLHVSQDSLGHSAALNASRFLNIGFQ